MTPEEKAKELYGKMLSAKKSDFAAKESALIAVEEIIKVVPFVDKKHAETIEQYRASENQFLSYWYKVKEEIKKTITD